jgi:hypothetical protein
MRKLPMIALLVGASPLPALPPAGAQGAEKIDCQFVGFVRCTARRECREEAPNAGERAIVLAIDFPARTLAVRHQGATLASMTIHRVWHEGGKRLFIVAAPGAAPAPDATPYELTGMTLSFPNDSSGSKSTLACTPAPS